MKKLTSRHYQAIELLSAGQQITVTAETVGVSRKTVYAWLDDDLFSSELKRRQSVYLRRLNTRLINGSERALEVLLAGLESESETIRIRSASIITANYLKVVEIENILERLDRLENAKTN